VTFRALDFGTGTRAVHGQFLFTIGAVKNNVHKPDWVEFFLCMTTLNPRHVSDQKKNHVIIAPPSGLRNLPACGISPA
jgi:hypothetical protein